MQSITNHAAPNVVPGLNFNTERFQQLFAWIEAIAADAARAAIQPHRYGLLIAFDGKASLQLDKTGNSLSLRRCAGITPSGRIVGIFEGFTPTPEIDLEACQLDPKTQYQVLVEVDPSKRAAFGRQAADFPERPEFAMPACRLHVQAVGQLLGEWPNAFPIARLTYRENDWELTAGYIPPCAHLAADLNLQHKHREYREAMKNMLSTMPGIIRQTSTFRDRAMIELREFILQCGSHLAERRASLFTLTDMGRPFDLLEPWMAFAELANFLLNGLADRPGFYNLLYANTRSVNGVMFTTDRLDHALHRLTNLTYDHCNIAQAIEAVDGVLELVAPLFKALGNATLQPLSSGYEEVLKTAPAVPSAPKQPSSTW